MKRVLASNGERIFRSSAVTRLPRCKAVVLDLIDAESLDVAIDVLEALQAQGRRIGVISPVDATKVGIPVRVHVVRRATWASEVELTGVG